MSEDALDPVDREALQRCLALRLADRERAEHVSGILQLYGWFAAADFCSSSLQREALALRPWQSPPSWADDKERDADAIALAARLRAAGLSKYEPDPAGALARAERPLRSKRRAMSK